MDFRFSVATNNLILVPVGLYPVASATGPIRRRFGGQPTTRHWVSEADMAVAQAVHFMVNEVSKSTGTLDAENWPWG